MRFTKSSIEALVLPSGKSDLLVFDDQHPGFGFRIRAGGKRTWVLQYRAGSRQRRLTLGSYPMVGIDAARSKAKVARRSEDPQGDKAQQRASAMITLRSVIDDYLPIKRELLKKDKLRPSTYGEITRYLTRVWKPLHARPIADIGRADVANQLLKMSKATGVASADRARATLSALFTWAWKQGLVETNPVLATERPAMPLSRDRVLTDGELIAVWKAVSSNHFGAIVRLLILTGQRREEVSAMRWSELDLDAALWSLPGERTKNRRPHDVPLSDQALEVINGIDERADRDLIFGFGRGGFSGWSSSKARLDRVIEEPIEAWRLHDLRRTAATRMSDLGVQPHIVEAVLNHVSGSKAGIAGIYNRSSYAPEKRAALAMWGEHVIALAAGAAARVVPLRGRRSTA